MSSKRSRANTPNGEPAVETPAEAPHEERDVEMEDADNEPVVQQVDLHQQQNALLCQLLSEEEEEEYYYWDHLTTAFASSAKSGTADIDEVVLRIHSQPELCYSLFYEAFWCVKLHPDRIPTELLSSLLAEVISQQSFKHAFISTLNMFVLDTSLKSLVHDIRVRSTITELDLGKYLLRDEDFNKFEIIRDFERKKRQMRTKKVEQVKFNLLHESIEGYAKLAVLLQNAFLSETSHFEANYTAKATETIIGHFNLDPIRTLQLVLSVANANVLNNYRFIVDYLKASPWWPVGNEGNPHSLETLNQGGNKEATSFLALQLQDKKHSPRAVRFLTVVLIRCGFISFGSLFELLSPDDKAMEAFSDLVDERIEEEIMKATANALALAAPLAEEDDNGNPITPSAEDIKKKQKAKDPSFNIKFQILDQLLSCGAYYPSLYMVAKYPKLAYSDDRIVALALRLFNHMVSPLKEQLKPLSSEQFAKLQTPKTKEAKKTPGIRRNDNHSPFSKDYFYTDWSSDLPVIKSINDLMFRSNEFLSFFGAKIGEDPHLISLLSKVGLSDLKSKRDTPEHDNALKLWFDFSRKFILPASTFILENPIAAHDMFALFRCFPMEKRYNMYGDFQAVTCKRNVYAKLNYGKAEKATKDILKRLTKENVRSTMRRLSKITFANPLPAFFVIISQIESYDNLTNLVVEAARYFTDYAWDVLVYVLLNRLTQRRPAIQDDGINDAAWLQSLSTFIGKLAKSYTAFDIRPLLTFALKSIHDGSSVGLTIIKQLVSEMGGIQNFSDLSLNQIKALSSSESMQKITRRVIMDTRDASIRSGSRLVDVLAKTDQLSEFFVLLCSYSKDVLEKTTEESHFKVITDRSDFCTSVLHTYCQLVNFFGKSIVNLFEENVVTLTDLIGKYGVNIQWAFELWRKHIPLDSSLQLDVEHGDLSNELFSQFWRLALYDIVFESKFYDDEIEHLEAEIRSIDQRVKIMKTSRNDPEDVIKQEAKMKAEFESKKQFNTQILSSLSGEKQQHSDHFEKVQEALEESRKAWFADEVASDTEIELFVQFCVVPRILHAGIDAVFTANFITSTIGGENALKILKYILSGGILSSLLFTLTASESENLGLFVAEIFSYVNKDGTDHEVKKAGYYWSHDVLSSINANIIETDEYLSRRNTYTFLKNIIPVISIDDIGIDVTNAVKESLSNETRDDLKLACNALIGLLKSASKNWSSFTEALGCSEEESAEFTKHREPILKRRVLKSNEEERLVKKKKEEAAKIELQERQAREAAAAKSREEEARIATERRQREHAERLKESEKREAQKKAKQAANPAPEKLPTSGDEMDIDSRPGSPDMKDETDGDVLLDLSSSDALLSEVGKVEDTKEEKKDTPSVEPLPVKSEEAVITKEEATVQKVPVATPATSATIDSAVVVSKESNIPEKPIASTIVEEKPMARPEITSRPRARRTSGPLAHNPFLVSQAKLDEQDMRLIEMVYDSDTAGLLKEIGDRPWLERKLKENLTIKRNVRLTLVDYFKIKHQSEPDVNQRATIFEEFVFEGLDNYDSRSRGPPTVRAPLPPQNSSIRAPLPPQNSSVRAPLPPQNEILPSQRHGSRSHDSRSHDLPRRPMTTGRYNAPQGEGSSNSSINTTSRFDAGSVPSGPRGSRGHIGVPPPPPPKGPSAPGLRVPGPPPGPAPKRSSDFNGRSDDKRYRR